MIHHGRELVVEQVVVEGLTRLFVEKELLAQAETDGHGHAAVHLCFCKGGVDEISAVVDVDDVLERDLAHRDIDLDVGKGAAKRIGVVADGVGRLGGDVLGVRGVVLRGHRKVFQ